VETRAMRASREGDGAREGGEAAAQARGNKGVSARKPACQLLPGGFAGTGPNGSFFESPPWVDTDKAPGTTSQAVVVGQKGWWFNSLTGVFLFYSPNLVWLLIAMADYYFFPYDLEAAKSFNDLSWVTHRLLVNTTIVMGYFAFWHVALYLLHWSERPFKADRQYRVSKLVHNVWYTFLGAVQWTVWEAVMMHCYATHRIPYLDDATAFNTTWWNLFVFVWAVFAVPLWREFHFYFAHRFIHIKALYKYVHSLHHRNTDIEPFSGLCMHPIEHLYYYACIAPSLFMFLSPFAFMWNGVHLLISPAASHSGWEDHWQSDQYHYLHHRYFECNYGTGGTPMDYWFGTFRDKLSEKGSTYKGGASSVSTKAAATHDAKATLLGLPSWDFVLYLALNAGAWWGVANAVGGVQPYASWNPHYLAFAVGFGPVVLGQVMGQMTERLKRPILYPFHKDAFSVSVGHLLVSTLVTALPVHVLVHMLLAPPGESAYCQLWAC